MTCSKRPYTKKEATAILKRVKKLYYQNRREKRIYYCQDCNSWHLTSKEDWVEWKDVDVRWKERWEELIKIKTE